MKKIILAILILSCYSFTSFAQDKETTKKWIVDEINKNIASDIDDLGGGKIIKVVTKFSNDDFIIEETTLSDNPYGGDPLTYHYTYTVPLKKVNIPAFSDATEISDESTSIDVTFASKTNNESDQPISFFYTVNDDRDATKDATSLVTIGLRKEYGRQNLNKLIAALNTVAQ